MDLAETFVLEEISVAIERIDLQSAKVEGIFFHILPLKESFHISPASRGGQNLDSWCRETLWIHTNGIWIPNASFPVLAIEQSVGLAENVFWRPGC